MGIESRCADFFSNPCHTGTKHHENSEKSRSDCVLTIPPPPTIAHNTPQPPHFHRIETWLKLVTLEKTKHEKTGRNPEGSHVLFSVLVFFSFFVFFVLFFLVFFPA